MQQYRDDGIVLRTQKLGEADRIITVLGRSTGRVRAVAKGVRRTKSRFGARLEPFTHVDLMLHPGRSLDVITQAEVIRPYGKPLTGDYPRYTAGVAMLETAERFTPVEKEPALRQLLLLIGGLRALGEGEHDPRLILDAFLLRSLAVAGYAPALTECARCGASGSRGASGKSRDGGPSAGDRRLPGFAIAAGGMVCASCRPPGAASPAAATVALMLALLQGDWDSADRSERRHRVECSGLVAAYLQWHLEHSIRSLRHVERVLSGEGNVNTQRPAGVRPPDPHPSGMKPPDIPAEFLPRHVALVMDGDGRWARKRGLPRTEGHKEGESSLLDVIMGAIELGIPYLSAYAFSTENWRRSPDEVRFLMGFNRDVIHRRRDLLNEMGVRIRWAGRRPRLWRSVISELEYAEQMSAGNSVLTLQFCVNYGGRAEIADAAAAIAADVAAGKLRPEKIDEKVFARYLDEPEIPEVDLFVRSSGEQRLSNFLLWQSAYAELVFLDTLWPDFDRRHLWHACEIYASRDRRYGGAEPNPVPAP
jgi:trans,polycis-polyprenyl diphosphate synthase